MQGLSFVNLLSEVRDLHDPLRHLESPYAHHPKHPGYDLEKDRVYDDDPVWSFSFLLIGSFTFLDTCPGGQGSNLRKE